ncbi:MAG: hypothetical protein BWY81_01030 [Firmicutes bacterium ADurb.Bin467]|nr:MAG: hypothetical protein BWY81_01030 [Firmicutes bacterium ADurb.Bin467]
MISWLDCIVMLPIVMLSNRLSDGNGFFSLEKMYSMDRKFWIMKDMPIVVIRVAMGMDFFLRRGSSAALSMSSANMPEATTDKRIAGSSPNFRDTKKYTMYAPNAYTAPWEKLMSRSTPKTIEYPTAISAYAMPSARPLIRVPISVCI